MTHLDFSWPLVPYLASSALLAMALFKYLARPNLEAIPAVGPSGTLTSFWGAWRFLFHAHDMIKEGYAKHKGSAFKVPNLYEWFVVVTGPQLTKELCNAPDNKLSFRRAVDDFSHLDQTLGQEIQDNRFDNKSLQLQLVHNLEVLYSDVHDEIVISFDEYISLHDEWVNIPATDTILNIVCRATSRFFVGLPLCRDPSWIALNVRFSTDATLEAYTMNMFPQWMVPLVAKFLPIVSGDVNLGAKLLKPVVEERQRLIDEHGNDWVDKPNDLLAWLMDGARGKNRTVRDIAMGIMVLNFSAVATTAMIFTQALLYLAANPQFLQPLRDEVDSVVEQDGWSENALAKMRKIDSFLKETQRLQCINEISIQRKALNDFTFSDGTFIPAGTFVCAAASPTHRDHEIYNDPDMFDPFRFAGLQCAEGERNQHLLTSPTLEYLPFGIGSHVCPGRFFAAAELKTMLAHTVATYDVKLENDGVRPAGFGIGVNNVPNLKAKVMFRKRAV